MSKALIKKSLELLHYETDVIKEKHRKKGKSSGTLDLIPINHRVIIKNKKHGTSKRGSTVLLKRSSKLTVHDAKKQLELKTDPTEENVRKLLSLSGTELDSETTEKLITRAAKKQYITKEEPIKEESTVFTEEDFKKFEAEYFD